MVSTGVELNIERFNMIKKIKIFFERIIVILEKLIIIIRNKIIGKE